MSERSDYVARDIVITSERRDRAGDIVRAGGILLADYARNPVVLFGHGFTSAPIPNVGTGSDFKAIALDGGVPGISASIAFSDVTELARNVAEFWRRGDLRATSIGFMPDGPEAVRAIDAEGRPADRSRRSADLETLLKEAPKGFMFRKTFGVTSDGEERPDDFEAYIRREMGRVAGLEFMRWYLLEFSVVPVPMNPDACARFLAVPEFKALALASNETKALESGPVSVTGRIETTEEEETFVAATDPAIVLEITSTGETSPPKSKLGVDLNLLSAHIRDTSPEICPECGTAQPFHRPTKAFVVHHHEGVRCAAPRGLELSNGLTYKQQTDRFRKSLGHDQHSLYEYALESGQTRLPLHIGLHQMVTRMASALVVAKEGRKFSSASMSEMQASVDEIMAGCVRLQSLLDSAKKPDEGKGAAGSEPGQDEAQKRFESSFARLLTAVTERIAN